MKDTGAGWDSCLYRVFIVGGICAVIASVVLAVILTPNDSRIPLYVGYGGMAGFVALLLAYWWVQLAFKGHGSAILPPEEAARKSSDLKVLQSWNTLFEAMAIKGGNREEMEKMQKQARRPLLLWFGMATGLVLYILVSMGVYIAGIIPLDKARYLGLGVPVLAILMYAISFFLVGKVNRANETLAFAPLGLSFISTPEAEVLPTADGDARVGPGSAVTLAGKRFGRSVLIAIESGKTRTLVRAPVESFEIKSKQGKLEALANSPEAVMEALKGLRAAKRWEGIVVRGGDDGVRVERKSRGQNMWLYDLWLIERILESRS